MRAFQRQARAAQRARAQVVQGPEQGEAGEGEQGIEGRRLGEERRHVQRERGVLHVLHAGVVPGPHLEAIVAGREVGELGGEAEIDVDEAAAIPAMR